MDNEPPEIEYELVDVVVVVELVVEEDHPSPEEDVE